MMDTRKLPTVRSDRFVFLSFALAGAAAGIACVKFPFPLAVALTAVIIFLGSPEALGFFTAGGLYLIGRTLNLGQEELFVFNAGSFLLPVYCLMVFLLLRKRLGAFASVLKCCEFWAVLGLGLLLLARLPESLCAEYGAQKVKYYLVNNMVCFFGPVLSAAVYESAGLNRFLKGVFLGGLALTAYFWLAGSYLELPFNVFAVLNFNPIELARLIGLFALVAVFGGMIPLPIIIRIFLAAVAVAAMILLNARGPTLALAASLLFGGVGAAGGKVRPAPLLTLPLLLLMALYISSNYWFSSGFFSLDDTGRLQLYRAALWAFTQNPLLGAGTGSYAFISPVPGISYPHNLFLESAAELGVPGLALCLLLVFAPLARYTLRGKRTKEAALAVALLVFCLINAMVSGDMPGNFTLWLAAGVAAALTMAASDSRR